MIELKCVGKDVRAFKRCPGYIDIPEHMMPIDEFNDDDHYCKECRSKQCGISNAIIALTERYIARGFRRKHPRRQEIHAFAREVYNGNKPEQELQEFIEEIEAEAWVGTIFPKSYEPKPLRTVITTVKPRNTSLVTYLKEKYNYTCQVRGCSEQEVDVAHLHPHRYKDSVDNETNATVLCKNHHWSLDHRRMYIEDDLSFTRYNLDGMMIEESIIECHEDHNIDAKFITKSQDWFLGGADDRKE